MKFDKNPLKEAAECGLEIFAVVNTGESTPDILVVWRKISDGTLWYDFDFDTDEPFDIGRHELVQITNNDFQRFEFAVAHHYNIDKNTAENLLHKVFTEIN